MARLVTTRNERDTGEFAPRNGETGKQDHIKFFRFTGIRNTRGRRTRAEGPLTSSEHGKYISNDPFTAEAASKQDLLTFYNESKRDSRHFKFQWIRSEELHKYVEKKKVEEHHDYLQALYAIDVVVGS